MSSVRRFYFTHPVNVAASLLMPPGGRLECRIEMSDPRIRTDVRWVYRHGNKTINVAVLEFKNTKVIHRKYFENAMTSSRGAAKKVRDAQELQPATYFEGNALWLSKQAIKYYWPTECPDIAIFDWDVMFIFNFHEMNEDASCFRTCSRERNMVQRKW
jgi:hypothetical protein